MIRSGAASPAHAAKSWRQSSGASLLSVKVSVSFAANAVPRNAIRQRSRLTETSFAKHRFPLRTSEQWMYRAQIPIAETPPTAGQTENGFRPQLRRGHVHENQRTA